MDSTLQMLALETWNWIVIVVCIAAIIAGVVMRKKEA
jgi:hypothetical protein